MTVLSAQTIRRLCDTGLHDALVTPFLERWVHQPTGLSYGLGPASYDLRLDKLNMPLEHDAAEEFWEIPPDWFRLGSTVERFCMPDNLCAHVMDKSSLARKGLSLFNTHIDPGWRGYLTLEISNRGAHAIRLYRGQPIAQVKFERLDALTQQPYRGKYQDQVDRPVAAIVEDAAPRDHLAELGGDTRLAEVAAREQPRSKLARDEALRELDAHISASAHYSGHVNGITRHQLIGWRSVIAGLAP